MSNKLARVRWEIGQTLLPDHFESQEESYLNDVALRFRLTGIPSYGLGYMQWNESLLLDGIFSLNVLTYVLPSGLLIELNSNASLIPEQLSFTDLKSATIYVHIVEETKKRDFIEFDNHVYKNIYKLVLSLQPELNNDSDLINFNHYKHIDTFKLASFKQQEDNTWMLDSSYVPPLLLVGTSPFLRKKTQNIAKLLSHFQYELKKSLSAKQRSGDHSSYTSLLLNKCYECMRLINNINAEVHCHPYELYKELQLLYTTICLLQGNVVENVQTVYQHTNLASLFNELFNLLYKTIVVKEHTTHIQEFTLSDGIFQVKTNDFKHYPTAYIVVSHKDENLLKTFKQPKIALPNRLPDIHRKMIQGITLQKVEIATLSRQFTTPVECYKVIASNEWEHIVQERLIGFYAQTYLKGYTLYFVQTKESK